MAQNPRANGEKTETGDRVNPHHPPVNRSCLIVVDNQQPPLARPMLFASAIQVGTFCWVLWLDSHKIDSARTVYRVLCDVDIPEDSVNLVRELRKSIEERTGIDLDAVRFSPLTPLELMKKKDGGRKPEIYDEVAPYPEKGHRGNRA